MPDGAVGGKAAGLEGWEGYGWYLGLVCHVLYLFLVLPFPLPFLSLPFPLGFLTRRLGKDVGDGDRVLEDLLGGLFEGLVVAHLHGDCPRERVPGFFDIGKALRVLSGKLDESFDICVNGLLVGDLNENPSPSNCI